MRIESKAMRNSARGEACTLNVVGICSYRIDTTVLCHLPSETHGISRKSDDLSACYGCDACHAVIDGRTPWPPDERLHRDWYMRRAQERTLRRMFAQGILSIKGAAA